MRQLVTTGIVLSRTDFGEADRIVTVLTPDHGKLRLMARGVRKAKSKLAGGIELFSISQLTYIPGRGEIGTMVSTRLETHYGSIVKDITRVQLGYELIKQLNRATEDNATIEYFSLLQQSFAALNDATVALAVLLLWFQAQLLQLGGSAPNLRTDSDGQTLVQDASYGFNVESMSFTQQTNGRFTANHIKLLRLLFSSYPMDKIAQVQGMDGSLDGSRICMQLMVSAHLPQMNMIHAR